MLCFNHTSSQAIGMCKACQKGLCSECAVETSAGIACPGDCETRVVEVEEMNERGLKVYGIGKYKSRLPSSGVLLWGTMAALVWAIFGFLYYRTGYFHYDIAVPAVFFTIIAAFAVYSSRRSGINC